MKKRIPLYILGVVAAAAFPMVFLWMNNVQLVDNVGRILFTLNEVCGGALALWALFGLLLRDMGKGTLCTVALVMLFENGAMLQNLMTQIDPSLRYWHTVMLLAVLLGILIWLVTHLKKETSATAAMIVSGLFLFYIVLNVGMALPQMLASGGSEKREEPVQTAVETNTDGVTGRNVYWLLYDEYSSNYVFDKYFSYDNTPFSDALEELGFNVSYTSQNEGSKTLAITANIANLDYAASYSDQRTAAEDYALVQEAQKTAVIIPMMESHGYDVVGIGEAVYYGFTGQSVSGRSSSLLTLEGEDIIDLFWKQTLIAPFMILNTNKQTAAILEQFAYLQDPNNIPTEHTFVLSHIDCPHIPFLFRADGSLLPANTYNDMQYYVGQCQYVNSVVLKTVKNIIDRDPTAIIAVLSDHGQREGIPYEDKRRIFAALYDGGEKIDIEGYSGMNIMITMLNEALGTSMEYVEPIVQEEVTTH